MDRAWLVVMAGMATLTGPLLVTEMEVLDPMEAILAIRSVLVCGLFLGRRAVKVF